MLKKLKMKNFRCFDDFEIIFSNFNVVVGKNNTGKSTIVDALKLVAIVCRYAPYRERYLKDSDIPFSQTNLSCNYVEKETVIHAEFSDNVEVSVIFPVDGRPYADFFKNGRVTRKKTVLRQLFKDSLGIIPPVSTFEEFESIGNEKYVREVLVSHLTPRHFRNIWHYFKDDFDEFCDMIQRTWPGYTITPPEVYSLNKIRMFFKEYGIDREIFWGGHGFQVWLQLMTFLVKLGRVDTLVLDEPDIYLHSDMQRKLVRICKERSNQLIIATHAVDIIEEVEPEDILTVDKDSAIAKKLSDINEVQTLITQLGSTQNLKLIHFYRGRTCLFVEGNDFRYLKQFAKKLNILSFVNEDGFSVVPIDGFANWDSLKHISWIYKNAFGEKIKCYVILDRDYHTVQEVAAIKNTLQRQSVNIHIWDKKEVENYVVNFDALYRIFTSKFSARHHNVNIPISYKEFKEKLLSFFEELKQHVLSQTIARETEYRTNRSVDRSSIVAKVMTEFEKNWKDVEFRNRIIPGKEFFARLNHWLNAEYHLEIPIMSAIDSMNTMEIENEIIEVLNDFIHLSQHTTLR